MESIQIPPEREISSAKGNNLFPVFLKLENLRVVIIGGGNVALEKLHALLNNSPSISIRVVALSISEKIKNVAALQNNIELQEKAYDADDLDQSDIIIAAVNNKIISRLIWKDAKRKGILINVADTPELCDFYLGSIVKKGNLKIAISTNGKSPTIAKRIKEHISEIIPDEIESVLQNMSKIRQHINGNFSDKVKHLDDLTRVLVAKDTKPE
jgi:uncharacterized protein